MTEGLSRQLLTNGASNHFNGVSCNLLTNFVIDSGKLTSDQLDIISSPQRDQIKTVTFSGCWTLERFQYLLSRLQSIESLRFEGFSINTPSSSKSQSIDGEWDTAFLSQTSDCQDSDRALEAFKQREVRELKYSRQKYMSVVLEVSSLNNRQSIATNRLFSSEEDDFFSDRGKDPIPNANQQPLSPFSSETSLSSSRLFGFEEDDF